MPIRKKFHTWPDRLEKYYRVYPERVLLLYWAMSLAYKISVKLYLMTCNRVKKNSRGFKDNN